MFMGDRWSFPKQASSATYVWQPLLISGTSLSIPTYQEAWQINVSTGMASAVKAGDITIENTDKQIQYTGNWKHQNNGDSGSESKSDEKNSSFSIPFNGQQIALYSYVGTGNGYAKIELFRQKGKVVLTSLN